MLCLQWKANSNIPVVVLDFLVVLEKEQKTQISEFDSDIKFMLELNNQYTLC